MKYKALIDYERPESEVMIIVQESCFLESVLESPHEQNDDEIDITQQP